MCNSIILWDFDNKSEKITVIEPGQEAVGKWKAKPKLYWNRCKLSRIEVWDGEKLIKTFWPEEINEEIEKWNS